MLTMLRNAVFIWPMVSCEVICAVPLQLAPAMFWLEAHILRASSSTVCACTSKRPAIDRISCGSVIKREGISLSLLVLIGNSSCSLETQGRGDPNETNRLPSSFVVWHTSVGRYVHNGRHVAGGRMSVRRKSGGRRIRRCGLRIL